MGPHFWTTAVLKISMSHSDISFFHFSGTFRYPKCPFAPQPLQIAYEKICMPLYLTNLSIVQFYLRFLDFVPFAKYASVTVWHVTFDPIFWENGFWQGYQRLSHTRILLLVCEKVILNEVQAEMNVWYKNTVQKSAFCHCVTFWMLFRFSHLTTTDPISSAYILIFSAPYSYLTKKKVHNLPLFASSYSYKRLEKVTSLIVTQWRSCFFTQKHPNVAMWNPSSPFCALLWRYLYKGRQNICL